MSVVKAFSVGNGDMYYIDHNSDNFTIIDCSLSLFNRARIVNELKSKSAAKSVTRFISTHPDEDHICGLVHLDDQMSFRNFYVVKNAATKDDATPDFDRYTKLRDSDKAFYLEKGCLRKWMNQGDEVRGSSGISILWPDPTNQAFKFEHAFAKLGMSPNNISPIIQYRITDGANFLWMGDLETEFMREIENAVAWPAVDVLFAPHHGRESGRVPTSILKKLQPRMVVIGEAPAKHLCYYPECDTITQNSAGDITFEEGSSGWTHVYASDPSYKSSCLVDLWQPNKPGAYYAGSFIVHAAVAA